MQAIFGFVVHHRVRSVNHLIGDFDVAVCRERVHVNRVRLGEFHPAFVRNPRRILADDFRAFFFVRRVHHRAPGFGVDNVGVFERGVHIVHHLKARAEFFRLLARLLHNLRHQFELRRMCEDDIHAETRHLQNERLRDRHRLLVRRGIRPRYNHFLAAQIAPLLFDDRHQVGEALERMVDVALHIEDRHARRFGDRVEVAIADAPVHVANRDAVEIAPENFADFFRRVAVRNLRRARFDERAVPAELRDAGFKRAARARAGEKEQHRQHLIAQNRVRFVQRAFAFQVERHVEDGFDFFF